MISLWKCLDCCYGYRVVKDGIKKITLKSCHAVLSLDYVYYYYIRWKNNKNKFLWLCHLQEFVCGLFDFGISTCWLQLEQAVTYPGFSWHACQLYILAMGSWYCWACIIQLGIYTIWMPTNWMLNDLMITDADLASTWPLMILLMSATFYEWVSANSICLIIITLQLRIKFSVTISGWRWHPDGLLLGIWRTIENCPFANLLTEERTGCLNWGTY